jgi:hypothetical protein
MIQRISSNDLINRSSRRVILAQAQDRRTQYLRLMVATIARDQLIEMPHGGCEIGRPAFNAGEMI